MTRESTSAILPSILGFDPPWLIRAALRHFLQFDRLEELHKNLRGTAVLPSLLDLLRVDVRISRPGTIPDDGPAVVLANHPFGLLDGAVLASLCLQVRNDVRVLANGLLGRVPELADIIIPVDVFGDSGTVCNVRAMRSALRHVSQGGLLLVFPSGEVATSTGDCEWNPQVARLITSVGRKRRDLCIVPAFVHGTNSSLFRLGGRLHPAIRTSLLVRELFSKRGSTVRVDFGSPVTLQRLEELESNEQRIDYLHWRTHVLGAKERYKPNTRGRAFSRKLKAQIEEPVRVSLPVDELERNVANLPPESILAAAGDLVVYLAKAVQIPSVLIEIGRLRELTFRAVGEGTGRAVDLDDFDSHYLHLFVWNKATREIVGAYRIGDLDKIRRERGMKGLYTSTLFSMENRFAEELGQGLELGRSFVRIEYQRTFAPLLLLWKGIGRYVGANPQHKVLFGPVSISNDYSASSRELMVAFLQRQNIATELAKFVRSRNPCRPKKTHIPKWAGIDDVSEVIAELENKPAGVPVLLRQYLKLGGKLVAFNVDQNFSDALDGLIMVDLTRTEPRLLERYLGRSEAQSFLRFHELPENRKSIA